MIRLNNAKNVATKTSNGTAYAVGAAVSGFQSVANIGNNGVSVFCCDNRPFGGTAWEYFVGTYTSGNNRVTRTRFLSSSTGAAINWPSGQKYLSVSPSAEQQIVGTTNEIDVEDDEETGERVLSLASAVTDIIDNAVTMEQVDDHLATAIIPGYDIEIEYDDAANEFTFHHYSKQTADPDASTITIDLTPAVGRLHDVTLEGDRDIEIANAVAGKFFNVRVIQGAGAPHVPHWTFPITWEEGFEPSLTPVEGKSDLFHFYIESVDAYGLPTCRAWVETTERPQTLDESVGLSATITANVETIQEASGGTNEVQLLRLYGTFSGGTFTLTFNGQTTSGITPSANAATVKTALENLSNIAADDLTVTGTLSGGMSIEFGGSLGSTNVSQMTVNASGLTGASLHADVSTTTQGAEATELNSVYAIFQEDASSATFEQQRLTGNASVTAGTFTITMDGWTTAAIAFDATPLEIMAAINSAITMSARTYYAVILFGADGSLVAGDFIEFTFVPDNLNDPVNISTMTVNSGGLTGGTYSTNSSNDGSGTTTPVSGDYTITVDGQTTASISVFDSDSTVEGVLEALSSVGIGNVSVTSLGTDSDHIRSGFLVEFIGGLAGAEVTMTINTSGISSGELSVLNQQTAGTINGTNEVQTLTMTGTPTQGTVGVTFNGSTATFSYDETSGGAQTKLRALASINGANVDVTGGPWPGTPLVATFVGSLAETNVAEMTTNNAGLWSAISTTTQGSSGSSNEIQEITITPDAAGGTYTLTYDGDETAPIEFDATAAAIEAALEAATGRSFTVTGGPLSTTAVQVEFVGSLAGTNVELIECDPAELLSEVAIIDWSITDFGPITLEAGSGEYHIAHVNLIPGKVIRIEIISAGATGTINFDVGDVPVTWPHGQPAMPADGDSLYLEFECKSLTKIIGKEW